LLICFARWLKRVTNISLGIYANFVVAAAAVAVAEVPFSSKKLQLCCTLLTVAQPLPRR